MSSLNDNNDVWGRRGERAYGTFTRHPIAWIISIIVVVSVLGFVGHFVGLWFNKAAQVAGPQNVSAQYQAVIGDWNAMQTAARNACAAEDTKQNSNSPTFLEDPSFAYKAAYNHATVDYNTRQNDIFEAGVVGPSGYPKVAPSLTEMEAQVC